MEHDKKAISLLHDFIREKLGGDIHKLRTFDFSSLDNDRKYEYYKWIESQIDFVTKRGRRIEKYIQTKGGTNE